MCFKPPWGQIFDTVCWTMWKVECQTVWQTVIIFCPDALSVVIRGSNFWESQKSSLYCKQLMAWKWVSFVMLMICHWMLFEAQDRWFRASSTGIIYSWSCLALRFLAISLMPKNIYGRYWIALGLLVVPSVALVRIHVSGEPQRSADPGLSS